MVAQLDALVTKKKMGIVAHFYMDPELQVRKQLHIILKNGEKRREDEILME